MLAAQLFEQGIGPAEVARRLGVTTGAASQWKKAWQQGGKEALRSVPHPGAKPKLFLLRKDPWRSFQDSLGPMFLRKGTRTSILAVCKPRLFRVNSRRY